MPGRLKVVDIVNLNSKASCLSSERWMKALEGGRKSELYKILYTYVELQSKVTLGIIGSTLADIKHFNPECIELICDNPEVFELIYRPYVHSLSIFWSDDVFKKNVFLGKSITDQLFKNVFPAYLPPEFVLRNSQLLRLIKNNIDFTFIHPNRVKSDVKVNLPLEPFRLSTIQQREINCIPFDANFDAYYLASIQQLDLASDLNPSENLNLIYGWRDGESPFFLPNSVKREQYFIRKSHQKFKRIFLKEALKTASLESKMDSYPQNSLLPWFSNFRLLWYINEVKLLEATKSSLTPLKRALFMMLLNSDVLSSTEKSSIKIRINSFTNPGVIRPFTIKRQARNLEAEEVMYLIENNSDEEIMEYLESNQSAFGKLTKLEVNNILQLTPNRFE